MQALFPSKTLSFMYLEHCKNFRESVPEFSYNEGMCDFISSPCIQRKNKWEWQKIAEAELGPEFRHPKPHMGNSPLYIQCVKALSTSENQHQSQALWQHSRRLLSQWHLAWPSAPNSLWSTPFWLFIKSIFSSFCIHSIRQFQIPFFYLI